MKKTLILCVFTLVVLIYGVIEASQGVRSVAMSGALRGTLGLNESIYINPAGFAFSGRYSIEAQSFYMPSAVDKSFWVYNASVVDSHAAAFAAGLAYSRKTKNTSLQEVAEHAYHLAFSKIMNAFIALGITGKYTYLNADSGEAQNMNVDVGSFVVLTPRIQLGLVGHNLLGSFGALKRQLGLGSRIKAWEFLSISADALKDIDGPLSQNISIHTALEVARENGLVTQGGIEISDKPDQDYYSFGLGWSEHKFGAFYAFKNSMDSKRRATHVLSMRIFFN